MSTNKSSESETVNLNTSPSFIHIKYHQSKTCPNCVQCFNWDFLKDFFVHEEVVNHQVQQLSFHVNELKRVLQYARLVNQNDHIVLNKVHKHIKKL